MQKKKKSEHNINISAGHVPFKKKKKKRSFAHCFHLISALIKNPKEWMFEAALTKWDSAGDELHYVHGEHHCDI